MADFLETKRGSSAPLQRAFLVGVQTPEMPDGEGDELLIELRELVENLGMTVVASPLVKLRTKTPATLIGKGKAEEISAQAKEAGCDVIVFDAPLSPAQQRNWEELSELATIDREEVILEVFADRAQTRAAVLQVALARMEYSLPRLTRAWTHLSRQRGKGAMGGEGETQLEQDRRVVRDRITRLKAELTEVIQQRGVQRRRRLRIPLPTAAIVGYTNAGKSSLLNALTGAHVLAEDKLFATLETRTRTLYLLSDEENGTGESLVLTDTVGFIRRLPKDLFAAFRATFEEAADADLLLHVLDASDDALEVHMTTTQELLKELELDGIERWIVLNKADRCEPERLAALERAHEGAIVIHASEAAGIVPLRERLVQWSREHRAKEQAEPRDDDDAVSDETHTESLVPAFEMPDERPWPATVFDDV